MHKVEDNAIIKVIALQIDFDLSLMTDCENVTSLLGYFDCRRFGDVQIGSKPNGGWVCSDTKGQRIEGKGTIVIDF